MSVTDGWLALPNSVRSPNADQRPAGEEISLLVLHNISLPPGEFGGGHVHDFFTNSLRADSDPYFETIANLRVSAHLFVGRDGAVTQFVSFADRAWHAGVSCFQGRERCNDFSIGIELEGTDIDPYTDEQYRALISVTKSIRAEYPAITTARIVGHADIAPGRKTDPGDSFDWYYFLSGLEGHPR